MTQPQQVPTSPPPEPGWRILPIGLTISVFLHLILSFVPYFFKIDMDSFRGWSSLLAQGGIPAFYGSGWCDYPPGYLYVLWLTGKVYQLFDANLAYTSGALFQALIKLTPSLADIGCAGFIFFLLKPLVPLTVARWTALAYVFNPFPILISTTWGQIDSVAALLMLGTIWLLLQGKFVRAALIGVIGVLVKPQGLFLAPVFFLSQWFYQPWWKWGASVIASLGLIWGLVTPFYWEERDFSSPLAILLNPYRFLYVRMLNTANGYDYASVNAFNLWGWANWQKDSLMVLGLSYKVWGLLLLLGLVIGVGVFFYRQRQPAALFLGTTIVLIGMFMLPTRMHERYVLYAIPFLALTAACYPRLRFVYWGWTLTGCTNTVYVLLMYNHVQFLDTVPATLKQGVITGTILVNLVLFLSLIGYAIWLQFSHPDGLPADPPTPDALV
ncbi:hypothetical protein [Leptolyngbya sp. 'hensonii']|uniref:hypothetical protein n=1 Tax=Leptolyngbya sp. 'hensonii' TaxID=1922337 RepID=UPI000A60196C|nr:hypothetical protein [Leptolyngbya sp. 'hensonii']